MKHRDHKALMREVDLAASTCRWPECSRHVPVQMCLCVEHWRTLPTEFRERLQRTHRGAANNMRAWGEIRRGIEMFKNNSENMQTRTRRQAEHSTANTGGIDMSAFDEDTLKTHDRILGEQVNQIEIKLARVKALLAEADLRRGTWGGRTIGPGALARVQQEKRLLLGELNAARTERMKFHNEVNRRNAEGRKENNKEFGEVFHRMAKEMLAGPVYDRIVTATLHRMSEGED
jgi:hypothetical protein